MGGATTRPGSVGWFSAVRHISPLLPPRTRADKEGKKKYGICLYPRKNVHVSTAHILCFLLYYTTISCVCKSNYRFLYQYIVFLGVIKRPPHHILYLTACIEIFRRFSAPAPKICIRQASGELASCPAAAVFSYHRLVRPPLTRSAGYRFHFHLFPSCPFPSLPEWHSSQDPSACPGAIRPVPSGYRLASVP